MKTQLPFFGVLRVTGEDRAVFLHNQLSNDIVHLTGAHAAYATYNTPQGRVIADMLVVVRGDDICLVMATDLVDTVMQRLRRFVLRSRVTMTVDKDLGVFGRLSEDINPCALSAVPPLQLPAQTDQGVTQVSLPHGGQLLLADKTQLSAHDAVVEQQWRRHEIICGYAHIAAATSETCVAQMLNQHLLGGVHFKKGCYPGQEVIARAQYRGQVRRGLAAYRAERVLAPGTKIVNEAGVDVGVVLDSVAHESGSLSLCVVKHVAAREQLRADHQTLSVHTIFFQEGERT